MRCIQWNLRTRDTLGLIVLSFVERSSLSQSSWYDTLLVTLGVALLTLETFLLTLHMNEGSVTEGSVTDDKDVWFLHFTFTPTVFKFCYSVLSQLVPFGFPTIYPLHHLCTLLCFVASLISHLCARAPNREMGHQWN